MCGRFVLACLIFTSCTGAGRSLEYALKGGEFEFRTGLSGQPDEILWKHNGNKVVEFNGKEEKVYGKYENRIILDWFSADLRITNLDYEDSGEYMVEAYVNKGLRSIPFHLEVIDKVKSPTISCEMNNGSDSNTSGRLTCSARLTQPDSLVKFEWSSRRNVQPGPQLTISLGDQHDEEVYNCTVSNPLSEERASFTAKECYPAQDSVGVIVGVVLAIVSVIGLAIFGFIIYKRCGRDTRKGESDENQTQHHSAKDTRSNTATDEEKVPILPPSDNDTHKITIEQDENNPRLDQPILKNRKEPDADSGREGRRASEEEFEEDANTNTPQRGRSVKELTNYHESECKKAGSRAAQPRSPSTMAPEDTAENKSDPGPIASPENEEEMEENLHLATPQQPRSSTPAKPDNRNISTVQESTDIVNAEPNPEEESGTDDSEEQSGKDTADVEKCETVNTDAWY